MSEKKSVRDEHGVHDLLQKVSLRNLKLSRLAAKDRKEVSQAVDQVEEDPAELEDDSNGKSNKNVGINAQNSSDSGTSDTKWGKGLFQKFSKIQNPLAMNVNTDHPQQKDPKTPRPDAKEFFRNFSIKNPLRSPQQTTPNGENNDERPEIKKAFERSIERSTESGKEMFQNISKNFQNFSKNFQNSLSPLKPNRTATASAVSDSLCSPPVKKPAVSNEN
jgi:hypothetical protein